MILPALVFPDNMFIVVESEPTRDLFYRFIFYNSTAEQQTKVSMRSMSASCTTVVEHSPHHPKVKGSTPAAADSTEIDRQK